MRTGAAGMIAIASLPMCRMSCRRRFANSSRCTGPRLRQLLEGELCARAHELDQLEEIALTGLGVAAGLERARAMSARSRRYSPTSPVPSASGFGAPAPTPYRKPPHQAASAATRSASGTSSAGSRGSNSRSGDRNASSTCPGRRRSAGSEAGDAAPWSAASSAQPVHRAVALARAQRPAQQAVSLGGVRSSTPRAPGRPAIPRSSRRER